MLSPHTIYISDSYLAARKGFYPIRQPSGGTTMRALGKVLSIFILCSVSADI
jgi:hypothetical protein